MSQPEPYENQIWCGDCNSYMHSNDDPTAEHGKVTIVRCPYTKDPSGQCTGRRPGEKP